MKKRSIAFKVSIFVVIIQLLIMSLLLSFAIKNSTEMLENIALSDLEVIARDRAELVEMYFNESTNFLDSFTKNEVVYNAVANPTPENIKLVQEYIDRYAEGVSNIEGLYVADMDTYVYAHTNPDSVNRTFREGDKLYQLQRMLERSQKAFCTGIVTAPVTKQHVLPSYMAIRDESGKCIGFAGCAHTMDAIENVLKKISYTGVNSMSYSLINVLTGEFIFAEDEAYTGESCRDSHILDIIDAINHRESDIDYQYIDGEKIASCCYLNNRNWLFVATNDISVIDGPTEVMQKTLMWICISATIILAMLCMLGVEYILAPFGKIRDTIWKLSKQNLSRDETIEGLMVRKDEVGSFAMAVDMLREALENQNEIYSELLKVQSIGFLSLDYDTNEIILINKEALCMLGISDEHNIKGSIETLYAKLNEDNAQELKQMVEKLKENRRETTTECKIVHSDEKATYALSHGKCVRLSTGKEVLVFSLTDITEKKELEDNLLILSGTDALTGISNRRSGESMIKAAIASEESGLYILFDVNRFKNINDTFGHSVGDEVLVRIARTMEKTFRASDVCMRMGGDEFVVYATDIPDEMVAKSVIERFLKNISDIRIEQLNDMTVSVSLGAVLCNSSSRLDDCMEKADSVMYECKKAGGNAYRIYTDISEMS